MATMKLTEKQLRKIVKEELEFDMYGPREQVSGLLEYLSNAVETAIELDEELIHGGETNMDKRLVAAVVAANDVAKKLMSLVLSMK